jgi:threonylcarbamoyladenosine tRNA methylthiotransferase MtaB
VKVYLRTFGCRANHYDTEAVRELVERNGHAIVSSVDDADVAVFNSCAVTSEAEAELRKVVRRAGKDCPSLKSVVMGCAAALDDERPTHTSLRALPTVERVVGGADLVAIADALQLRHADSRILTQSQTGTRALLRIQDGCDEHCTFCATTMARGANRSRRLDDVVREALVLAERHREIVITGIHIGTYGRDIGSSLSLLMDRLVREVKGARFRLTSIEATEIDERLLELLADSSADVVPHVHAPLQSGSDRVLRRMGRHWYTRATYASAVESLASVCPILGLGADIISGFPGETGEDHAATVSLVEQLPFTYLHVFPFSLRPGTPAERLANRVRPEVAAERARELRELGKAKAAAYASSRSGGQADVIAIGPPRGGRREGLTEDYLTVNVSDPSIGRGERFRATLDVRGATLEAVRDASAKRVG